jgi:hypothetical protein
MLFALMACTALASSDPNHAAVKASMLLTGWIDVLPDGSVRAYGLDPSVQVPEVVRKLVDKKVPGWKFRLDKPVTAFQHEEMFLRITATPVDDLHDVIAISGASFIDGSWKTSDHPSYKNPIQPVYPQTARDARVSGIAYLVLRINRQGKVEKVVAEQVDLDVYGPEKLMGQFRDLLAHAAIEGAKSATFNVPSTGSHVGDLYWDIRVPVTFRLIKNGVPPMDPHGVWSPYNPGPLQPASWLASDEQTVMPPDATPIVVTAAQNDCTVHLVTM